MWAERTEQHIKTLSCCYIRGRAGKREHISCPPNQWEPSCAYWHYCELESSSLKFREAEALCVSPTDFYTMWSFKKKCKWKLWSFLCARLYPEAWNGDCSIEVATSELMLKFLSHTDECGLPHQGVSVVLVVMHSEATGPRGSPECSCDFLSPWSACCEETYTSAPHCPGASKQSVILFTDWKYCSGVWNPWCITFRGLTMASK